MLGCIDKNGAHSLTFEPNDDDNNNIINNNNNHHHQNKDKTNKRTKGAQWQEMRVLYEIYKFSV